EPTAQMRFQFIASDSTRAGQYLDGGSLIEAAVDDFVLYDKMIVNVEEMQTASSGILVYPNPANDRIRVQIKLPYTHNARITLMDAAGRVVFNKHLGDWLPSHILTIPTSELAEGAYTLQLVSDEVSQAQAVVIGRD
ncbi:MAG: T9SS type A sorting domain-containing protein, partial [Flavobacteriales bacterium]